MLEARAVTVEIDATTLVDSASLIVAPGEVVVLVGPNGAGKTTLLKVLAGERRPDRGHALLDGRALDTWSARQLARERAVLPQSSTLAFAFTAAEVVRLGQLAGSRNGHRSDDDAILAALDLVDARQLANRLYTTLSGGEQQRVHLARVLAQIGADRTAGGGYLLLDEPTSSLDLAHQFATMSVVRKLAARGTGILVILHDLNTAALYADRIAVLKGGRILGTGTPDEVLTATIIGEAFGVAVDIGRHPSANCPLIVARPY